MRKSVKKSESLPENLLSWSDKVAFVYVVLTIREMYRIIKNTF